MQYYVHDLWNILSIEIQVFSNNFYMISLFLSFIIFTFIQNHFYSNKQYTSNALYWCEKIQCQVQISIKKNGYSSDTIHRVRKPINNCSKSALQQKYLCYYWHWVMKDLLFIVIVTRQVFIISLQICHTFFAHWK